MPALCHCQHCWGDCPGDCMLPGNDGACIHRPRTPGAPWRWVNYVGRRDWWRRVFWGGA